jgi:hypothetical protein
MMVSYSRNRRRTMTMSKAIWLLPGNEIVELEPQDEHDVLPGETFGTYGDDGIQYAFQRGWLRCRVYSTQLSINGMNLNKPVVRARIRHVLNYYMDDGYIDEKTIVALIPENCGFWSEYGWCTDFDSDDKAIKRIPVEDLL